jgi:hypothetical protein
MILSDTPSHLPGIPDVHRIAKPRRDRCRQWAEEERDAWEDLVRRRVNEILLRYDQTSFRVLVVTLGEAWARLAETLPGQYLDSFMARVTARYYVRLLDQVLLSEPQMGVSRSRQICDFIRILQSQFGSGLDDCLRDNQMGLFELYMGQVSDLYKNVCDWYERNSREPGASYVYDRRARWGMYLRLLDSLVSELSLTASAKDKGLFLQIVHRNCSNWARIATSKNDSECVASLGKVLADSNLIAHQWEKELSGETVDGMSFSDLLLLRHLALLGEAVQGQHALIKPLLAEERQFSQAKMVQVLSLTFTRDLDTALSDFGRGWDIPVTSSDPLLGSSTGGGYVGSPERDKLLLGTVLCLLRASEGSLADWPVQPIDMPINEVESAIATLRTHKDVIAKAGVYLFRPFDQDLLTWLRKCKDAYDKSQGIRLAKMELNSRLVSEYRKTFETEYPKSIPLLRFLVERGFVIESPGASITVVDYPPKEMFLSLEEKGYWENNAYERDAREWAVWSKAHFVKSVADEVIKRKPLPGTLSVKSDKDIAEAIRLVAGWLKATVVSPEAGLLLVSARVMLDRLAFGQDQAWVPSWRMNAPLEGFAGCYDGFPVWASTNLKSPLVAALDLGKCKPLQIRPCVREGARWCSVVEITRDLNPHDKRLIRERIARHRGWIRHYQVGHYSRRNLDFYWDVARTGIQEHSAFIILADDKATDVD